MVNSFASKQAKLVAAVRNYLQNHPEAAQRLRAAELQAHLDQAPLVDAQGMVDQPSLSASRSASQDLSAAVSGLPSATRLPDEEDDDQPSGVRQRPASGRVAPASAAASASAMAHRDSSIGSIDEYADLLTFGTAPAQPRALNFGAAAPSSSSSSSSSGKGSSTPVKGSGSRERYMALADEALDAMLELQAMPESSWEELHTKQGIVVSRRPVKGSPLNIIRGVGVVDASATDVLSLIVNVERRKCTSSIIAAPSCVLQSSFSSS